MKKIILLQSLLVVILFAGTSSCVTFKISERGVFSESKYKAEEYGIAIDNSDLNDQDKSAIKKIVNDRSSTQGHTTK